MFYARAERATGFDSLRAGWTGAEANCTSWAGEESQPRRIFMLVPGQGLKGNV